MTGSPSRRSVLTAVATVPIAGLPALADIADAGKPDPVFALIEAAKQADACFRKEPKYRGGLAGNPQVSSWKLAGRRKLPWRRKWR
jgi:hypothetical protein